MKYLEIRDQIKSGDVLAWTEKGWGSWYNFQLQLVRFGTQSEYCHVGVAYVVGGRVFVLESVGAGIRMFPLSLNIPFYWIPTKDSYWNEDVLEAALSKMGQQYSKWDGILSLWRKIKPGVDNKWQCAEYVRFILQAGGINIDCRNIPSEVVGWVQQELNLPLYLISE